MKHALVTGASGFIGAHVVRELLARDVHVRALVLPGDPAPSLRGLAVERRHGDVCDRESLVTAMRDVDHVFHLAAVYQLWTRDRTLMHRVNVEGTRNVLDAAAKAGVQRVIHTSSIARFGGQGLDRQATEDSPFALGITDDVYAQSKADAHEIAVAAARGGQDVVIVAPTGPIGPGDFAPTPTGRLLLTCATLPVVLVVRSVCNFGDVRAIAEGHVLAALHGRAGESYLLGGRDLTFAQIAELAIAAVGRGTAILELPHRLAEIGGTLFSTVADRVTHRAPPVTREAAGIARLGLAADCGKAIQQLGYRPRAIDLAVADALDDFGRRGMLRRSPRN